MLEEQDRVWGNAEGVEGILTEFNMYRSLKGILQVLLAYMENNYERYALSGGARSRFLEFFPLMRNCNGSLLHLLRYAW